MQAPPKSVSQFFNYMKTFSIVLLVVLVDEDISLPMWTLKIIAVTQMGLCSRTVLLEKHS